ncbi:hypothetical protein NQ317_009503 [Molorchus minor]|uniref:MICOS complex subunit n=1 Tax=Molorchus minor TaxID=1323400 RepID=A0ABQ9J458_9CUCU|nr:hypothetical protein NQ317_009503 [Molorchus minor]
MFTGQVIKRYIIPAAAIVVETQVKSRNEETVCRPSELPIYTSEPKVQNVCNETKQEPPGALEDLFRTIRVTITKYNEDLQAYKRVGLDEFEKNKERIDGLITYLQQEDNTLPKAGAIGIGALTGLIFGLRGGFFKKTVYATTGALGMSAVCYPKEAAEYSQMGIVEAKKYLTIAYNFIYGVKKDDPPLELPSLPKFPTSISEAWGTVKSTATSFVSDNEQKEVKAPQEQVIDVPDSVPQVKDPQDVITESHSNAISKSCHCPVGACLHSEESPPATE